MVAEALKVVQAAGVSARHDGTTTSAQPTTCETGEVLPDAVLEELRGVDAILLGAVGPPIGSREVPPGTLERGLLLRLRFELDLYINLRPFNGTPTSRAPGADFVVVRENTEGPYAGEGGSLAPGHAARGRHPGLGQHAPRRRAVRALRLRASPRGRSDPHVTLVHKTNVLTFAGDLWQRTFDEVAGRAPGRVESTTSMSTRPASTSSSTPERYGVIVTDNLFGDILTDLAGALTGGIGLAASANLNPARTGPSLFEPVHGAAHDIAGTGRANPLAAIRSAAMMLEHLGKTDAAERILKAVLSLQTEMAESEEPWSTASVGDAIAERL